MRPCRIGTSSAIRAVGLLLEHGDRIEAIGRRLPRGVA